MAQFVICSSQDGFSGVENDGKDNQRFGLSQAPSRSRPNMSYRNDSEKDETLPLISVIPFLTLELGRVGRGRIRIMHTC